MQEGELHPSVAEYQSSLPLCQSAKVFIWTKVSCCTWLLLLNRDSHRIPLPVGGNHMSLDRNSIKEPIRQFIAEYGSSKGITGIADDESLLKRNVFDSLGTFRLIAFVEEAFPLTVDE